MLDAIKIAMEKIQSPAYQRYGLTLASRLPIRMPTGWRFPYDSFAGPFRVRHSMVILFVSDEGEFSEEWNDLKREAHKEELETLYEQQGVGPLPQLPPLQTIIPTVMSEHPGAIIDSVEAVWAINEEGKPDLHWRLGLIEGIFRYVLVVGRDQKATIDRTKKRVPYLQKIPHSMSVASKWNIGRARFRRRSGNVTVNIKDLLDVNEDQEHLRSQWTVWCCMAHVAEFVEYLCFSEFGPHNVRVEYLASDASVDGAAFDIVRGVPTISFLRGGGWAEALSIVMHELGHALWALLYTRPPAILDATIHMRELDGIQEGFCDYFAATLLSEDAMPVVIGGELTAATASRYKLPRLIDGQPFDNPALANLASADEHIIGQKWANFLFGLRLALQQKKESLQTIDSLILRAHTKPLLSENENKPKTPMHCYLVSLRETAADLGMDSANDGLWKTLADQHKISS